MGSVWEVWWRDNYGGKVHWEVVEAIRRYVKSGRRVLEVGFGSGVDLEYLREKGYEVYGVESSRVAMKKVRGNFEQVFGGGVSDRLILADAESLPFADGVLDGVFHQGVMEHFRNTERFLYEQWRVLCAGGVLVVDVPKSPSFWAVRRWWGRVVGRWPFGWERGYSQQDLRETLEKRGFEVLETGYREVWPPRLAKVLGRAQSEWGVWRVFVGSRVGKWLVRAVEWLTGEWKYSAVYAIARKKKYLCEVAVDGRLFEVGAAGMVSYGVNVMSRLNKYRFWVIHQRELNTKLPQNCVKVRIGEGGKWWTDQVLVPGVLRRLGDPVYWQVANAGVPIWGGSKKVLTVHDVIPLAWSSYFAESRYPVVSRLLYWARIQVGIISCDRLMVDSPVTETELRRRFWVGSADVEVVPLGVETEGGRDRVGEGLSLLRRLGLKRGKYLLNNGGIDRRKNLERLIEAYARLPGKLDLVICGEDTGLTGRLRRLAESWGVGSKVKFVGRLSYEEVVVLVANARLVVYPTLAEGFGLPLLEAMGAGVGVVASDIAVLRWLGGGVPYYVDPGSVESIAKGIGRALGVEKARLARGVKRASEFGWERTAERVGLALRE